MRQTIKKWLLNFFGYTFLIIGVLGCFTPILPGTLFLFIGLVTLSKTAPWAKQLLNKFREKHPTIARKAEKFYQRSIKWRIKKT